MATSNSNTPPRRGQQARITAVVALLLLAGLAALVVWAVMSTRGDAPTPTPAPTFDRFETAWRSAMAKAGVEATFPAGPVDLSSLRVTGSRSFEATFTAEEITALLNVYPYAPESQAESFGLDDVEVGFPAEGVGALSGTLTTGDSTYDARIEGPIAYLATGIDSPGATSLVVEGFTVGGDRRAQATEAVVAYLNTYVRAAPGLVLERAAIVQGGVSVKGSAPQRIENP